MITQAPEILGEPDSAIRHSPIMSALGRLFGGGKKKVDVPPSPQDAIQRLRQTEEMLEKKTDFLEKKIQQEISNARKHGTKNKRGKKFKGPLDVYGCVSLSPQANPVELVDLDHYPG